jgi:hypothetical protein
MTEIDFEKLIAPFPANDIEWRAGATNREKNKALALAYITSRAVMNRLDDVAGPANWRDDYAPGPDGGVICGLSLRINGEWITKWDGAENSNFEAVKGGLSDAFKRAAVKWGIGRYLYNLDGVWTPCEERGKTVVLTATPSLPAWALPPQSKKPAANTATANGNKAADGKATTTQPESTTQPAPEEMTLEHAKKVKTKKEKVLDTLNTDQLKQVITAYEVKEKGGDTLDTRDREIMDAAKVLIASREHQPA